MARCKLFSSHAGREEAAGSGGSAFCTIGRVSEVVLASPVGKGMEKRFMHDSAIVRSLISGFVRSDLGFVSSRACLHVSLSELYAGSVQVCTRPLVRARMRRGRCLVFRMASLGLAALWRLLGQPCQHLWDRETGF